MCTLFYVTKKMEPSISVCSVYSCFRFLFYVENTMYQKMVNTGTLLCRTHVLCILQSISSFDVTVFLEKERQPAPQQNRKFRHTRAYKSHRQMKLFIFNFVCMITLTYPSMSFQKITVIMQLNGIIFLI